MLTFFRVQPLSHNLMFLFVLCAVAACGDGAAEGDPVQTAAAEGDGIAICDLLTDAEVSGVLPGHDGGDVAKSGGSMVAGVDSYQCSYSAVQGSEFNLMTVIVTVASSAELFDSIKPTASVTREIYDNFREIQIADGGFLYGAPDDMKVDAWKGASVISLELMTPQAESHGDALVALASTVAAKIE